MNLYEYQGKELFARFGIPVLPGQVAATPEEARDIAGRLGGLVVIKAQVMAGGRGKAGGVKLAQTPDEAYDKARDILALTIKGLPVRRVLVAQAADIARELYLSIVMDRQKKLPLIMLSAEGGVDIEDVAHTAPEKIIKQHIPLSGIRSYEARALLIWLARSEDPDWVLQAEASVAAHGTEAMQTQLTKLLNDVRLREGLLFSIRGGATAEELARWCSRFRDSRLGCLRRRSSWRCRCRWDSFRRW